MQIAAERHERDGDSASARASGTESEDAGEQRPLATWGRGTSRGTSSSATPGTIHGAVSQANERAKHVSARKAKTRTCRPAAVPAPAQSTSKTHEVGYQGWSPHFQERALVRGNAPRRMRRPIATCQPASLSLRAAKQNGPASANAQTS